MAPRLKQDYPALIAEYDQRISAGETPQAIKATFQERGIHWGTFQNQRTHAKKKASPQETPMHVDQAPVEVLPGQMSIEDANTPAEVHYGAVHEFDALPDGYAKFIQPMREYTEAEDEALKESVRLFGFIGTIVRDQYGRILDGNQRSRVARWFGQGCPFTITHVRDDAHAIEIATQLNLARRHFTPEQRQQIAVNLREQGRSYRYIAEALHVSPAQALTDTKRGEAKAGVQDLTPETVKTEPGVQDLTPEPAEPIGPDKRIQGQDGKIYPDRQPKRSNGVKASTQDRQLARVLELLLQHGPTWDDKHWGRLLETLQTLRGTRDATAQA